MSSSDNIKDALQTAFPSTSPKDWKRRSKAKEGARTRRDFEHPKHGTVSTFEDAEGTITIDGMTPEGVGDVANAIASGDIEAAKKAVERLVHSADPATALMHEQIAASVNVAKAQGADLMLSITEMGKTLVRDLSDRVNEVLNADVIKAGDRICIPVGTDVYSYSDYEGGSLGERWKQTEDEDVTVVDIVTIADYLSMAKPESCIRIADIKEEVETAGLGRSKVVPTYHPASSAPSREEEAFGECRFLLSWVFGKEPENDPKRRSYWLQRSDRLKHALAEVKQEVEDEWGENPQFVMWGTPHARRVALIGDVVKVVDKADYKIAAAPKKKEKAVTKRSMMVPGSTWRFTQDVEIKVWVRNPKIDELIRKRDSQPRSASHRLGQYGSGPVADACQTEINRLLKDEKQVEILGAIIKAGTVVQVVGKISASGLYSYGTEKSNGLLVPVIRDSGEPMQVSGAIKTNTWLKLPGKKEERVACAMLPYSQIEKIVEAESVPESVVYVLRDQQTGDYFGGWTMEEDHYGHNRSTNDPKMSSTFSGAKKYKTAAAAKASIRDFTGYNEGLDDEGATPEWVGIGYSSKKMDLPETWELVGIDKTTNVEKSVEDIQTWFKGLMRLRVLTKGHGPAVRGAFKKAEGVEGIESILLFTNYDGDNPYLFEDSYPDGGKAMLARIDASTKNFTKKPIRVRSPASVAFACSFDDAVLAKMTFTHDPNIKVKILDSTTLEEMVEAQ